MKKILEDLRKMGVNSRHLKFLNPKWYQDAAGGTWDETGKLQFEFLIKEELKPEHFLLDVGCGSLRGGIHFIRYLDRGRYYGRDMDESLSDAGKSLLGKIRLTHKKPTLTS